MHSFKVDNRIVIHYSIHMNATNYHNSTYHRPNYILHSSKQMSFDDEVCSFKMETN